MTILRSDPSQRILVAGLLVSLITHASLWLAASGFVRSPSTRVPLVPAVQPPVPRSSPPKPVVKLGIDDPQASGLAWLGFREPTPHEAPQAVVNQSAMTPSPGTAAAESPPVPPPSLAPTPPAPPQQALTSQQFAEAAQALNTMGSRVAEAVRAMSRAATAAPPKPTPTAARTAQPASSANKSGTPGLASDKDSIATSVKKATSVRLGQVAAAEGLDIQTKSPKWSVTTMQTRRPANPTIRITFGRDGKVVRAAFVTDGLTTLSTGFTDVDEPLMSAVYSWIARGQRLAELTSQDPDGEVSIYITVILAG